MTGWDGGRHRGLFRWTGGRSWLRGVGLTTWAGHRSRLWGVGLTVRAGRGYRGLATRAGCRSRLRRVAARPGRGGLRSRRGGRILARRIRNRTGGWLPAASGRAAVTLRLRVGNARFGGGGHIVVHRAGGQGTQAQ